MSCKNVVEVGTVSEQKKEGYFRSHFKLPMRGQKEEECKRMKMD